MYSEHKQYYLILCETSRLSVLAVKLAAPLRAGRQGRRRQERKENQLANWICVLAT